jgi:hypothetical protein
MKGTTCEKEMIGTKNVRTCEKEMVERRMQLSYMWLKLTVNPATTLMTSNNVFAGFARYAIPTSLHQRKPTTQNDHRIAPTPTGC